MRLPKINLRNSKPGLWVSNKSPELLLAAGIAGVITSTVLACRSTVKAVEVFDEHQKNMDIIKDAGETGQLANGDDYSLQEYKEDLTKQYVQTGVKLAKLYLPSIILGGLSIVAISKSHVIMKDRNANLAAAYATLDTMYKTYRNNVKEKYGEEEDFNMRYGVKTEEFEEEKALKNGEKKTVTKKVKVMDDIQGHSEYSRFFDSSCPNYCDSPEYNLSFLTNLQEWFNRELRRKGFIFLNEVYEKIGVDLSHAGQQIGWIYDKNNEEKIDFGIFSYTEANRRFVNGYEPVILLDFNVDGVIIDKVFPNKGRRNYQW